MSRWTCVAVGAILLAGAWHLATLRPGHDWGDDFALYLGHARNLAEGRPYHDTGYIYNPHFASFSPRTYPPVYPLLAAPVYRAFGLSLLALKAEMVLLFVLFLGVTHLACRRELPPACAAGTVVLLGFQPFFWENKDRLLSEVPFLLFCGLALYLLGRAREAGRLGPAVLAGVAVYLACGTRSAGVVLLPAAVLADVFRDGRRRRPGVLSAGVVLAVAAGVLAQRWLLTVDGSYLDQLVLDPKLFAANLVSLVKAMSLFLANGHGDGLRVGLFAAVSAVALLGYLGRLLRSPGAAEFFVPLYLAVVVVWPSAAWGQRFVVPLLPLYIVYFWHGVLRLGALPAPDWVRPRRVAAALGGGVAAALLLSYAGQYARLDFGPLREGVARPEAEALFDFVRRETPADAVFLFQKPRALALFTGRRASAHHAPATDAELWSYLRHIGASHLVVGRVFPDSHALLRPFVDRNPGRLRPVYANADFAVYRVGQEAVARGE
jgi:4-amino-4-deoxy-L-arabinose transferase-like glycosyltransferase